jgi:triacylglycerol lipase
VATTPQRRSSSDPRGERRALPPLHYAGRWQSPPPLWLEGRVAGEYVALIRDPVFRGEGVPRGQGRAVLLIPGFLAGDWSLLTLHGWLRRVGYRPELPGFRFNVDYSDILLENLARRLRAARDASGGPVAVVGHSRGGILAKVLGDRQPDLVSRVVTLGSPLGDPFEIHPVTMAGVRAAHLYNVLRHWRGSEIEGDFLAALGAPPRVPVTSIYSRTDGVVSWEACVRPDLSSAEVRGSHVGLAVNPDVYRLLARLLSS